MMYQTKRTCSRARGRSAWGCSRRDAMYTMSLHFMIKLFAPVVTYRKKTPQSIKSPREKNKRKNLYMCTRGSSTFWSFSRLAVQEPLRLPKPQVQFFVFYIPRTHLIKHILQSLLRQRRTLYILSPPQLSRQPLPLLLRYQPRRPAPPLTRHHPLHLLRIIPQIDLRPHYQARRPRAVV